MIGGGDGGRRGGGDSGRTGETYDRHRKTYSNYGLGSREMYSYGTRKTPKTTTTTTLFSFKFYRIDLLYSNFFRYSPM